MTTKTRIRILNAIADGNYSVLEAACAFDTTEAQVELWLEQHLLMRELAVQETASQAEALRDREVAVEAREYAARANAARWRARTRVGIAAAAAVVLLSAFWITRTAIAQACTQNPNTAGVLTVFCPQSPARAADMNHNFSTIYNWINTKLGNPNSPNVTVNGTVSATGNVSTNGSVSASGVSAGGGISAGGNIGGGSLSSSGDTNVGGYLNVTQGAQFQCSGCGSSGTLYGSANWGNLTIQGRVISASNNLHLSPPGGSSVVINGDYRAAGGGGGGVNLTVSGNYWDSSQAVGGSATSYGSEPTGDGWGRGRQACNNIESYTCPNGQYVCGIDFWHGCGWSWYDEVTRIRCCSL